MTCVLTLVITVLGQSYTIERSYSGKLVSINAETYTIDFSTDSEWLTMLTVPKKRCEKA